MRLLFVSPADLAAPRGGRAMLGRLHHDVLAGLIGDAFGAYRLGGATAGLVGRLRGRLDGATPAGIAATLAALDAHAADAIWLDGSNLGRLAEAVRRARPATRILTFCHNVEARFFLGAWRRSRGVRALGVLAGNYVAERLAVRHSSDLIALSARDGALLRRLYGRDADHLLPMAIADQRADAAATIGPVAADAPLLFVGGGFYANQAGIVWFARRVAPRLAVRVQVVGHGMETTRLDPAGASAIETIGAVGDLEPFYRAARAAIAPIFDGSGMKTKVAEALMFGKPVIGTPEAFSGYADDVVAANRCCADADGFVAAIRAADSARSMSFDPALRFLYERDHSPAALRARLTAILQTAVAPRSI